MSDSDKRVPVSVPTIHLNGTSADALIEQLTGAGGALRAAIRALDEAAPNARDYYVQGADAYAKASREHLSRVERVRAVLDEVYEINESLADAHDEQRRARGGK